MEHQTSLQLAGWLGCLLLVCSVIFALVKLSRLIRGPDAEPPNLLLAATVQELERRLGIVEMGMKELAENQDRLREGLEAQMRQRSAGMYERMDILRSELTTGQTELRAEMAKGFQSLERFIGRLEGRLDAK